MENSKQLANRVREVLLIGKWIANTNFMEQISDIDFTHATKQVSNLNTIAKLTFHVQYYIAGISDFFETGELLIRDKFSFDMEEINSQDDWEKLRTGFKESAERFISHIESFSDEDLEQDFVKKEYGNYRRNIEGMIEHAYYHLGQLSLINKMIRESQ